MEGKTTVRDWGGLRRSVEVRNLRIRPGGDLAITKAELGQLGVKKGVTARMSERLIL